jgi:outer membrane protein insertion porin family
LSRTVTLALNSDLGYAKGFGEKPVPFFKNYYVGGPGTVRGFRPYSLGPQDPDGNSLGGTRKVVANAEVLFPVPGAQQDRSLRLAAFLDAGQVFGGGEKFSISDLRYTTGLALAWTSPFGPLKLSIGHPLNEKKGFDRVQRLQFTFGSVF